MGNTVLLVNYSACRYGRTVRALLSLLVNHKFSLVNRIFSTDNYVLPLVNHAFPLVNRTFLSVESGTSLCLCKMRLFYFLISDFYIMCILFFYGI